VKQREKKKEKVRGKETAERGREKEND